jgi:hypothetical protein
MSSSGTRNRYLYQDRETGKTVTSEQWLNAKGVIATGRTNANVGAQKTVSVSHPRSRDGSYREGGPFYTSRVQDIYEPGHVTNAFFQKQGKFYSGPVIGLAPTEAEMKQLGYKNLKREFGSTDTSNLVPKGTTAISLCNPVNPAANLGTSLAESVREGIPSLPGIEQWRAKTQFLKGLGSEYLNHQFGWAPLRDEVSSVVNAARNHRDLLQQYHRGEGSDTHRSFSFPLQHTHLSIAETEPGSWSGFPGEWSGQHGTRKVSLIRETKCWFEGVFTYALPSSTDSWRKALGFGSDADQLFGLALSPDILWELTPWSWAVDWFSNTGQVINNVTNFGLAGLVMRYGYMMEESIETIVAEGHLPDYVSAQYHTNSSGKEPTWLLSKGVSPGKYRIGTESVRKVRSPASPFGFSIGWQDLSPTQLAITAALGITRLL